MKLFLRKYIFVIMFGICLYTILFAFAKVKVNYISYTFFISLIFSVLIRLVDDLCDYKIDIEKNKNVFNKTTIITLIIVLSILNIILIVFKKYLLLFLIFILLFINLFNKNIFKYFKSLYVPLICIIISYYFFGISVLCIVLAVISLIVDLYIIVKGSE